eukprot:COSAG03_NODE_2848_length_2408_cov_32.196104_2_plen_78_part_00
MVARLVALKQLRRVGSIRRHFGSLGGRPYGAPPSFAKMTASSTLLFFMNFFCIEFPLPRSAPPFEIGHFEHGARHSH